VPSDCVKSASARSQRSIYIWENLKYLIKPRTFENRANGLVHTRQEKLAAIGFNLFHGKDKCCQARAIDVSRAGKIYHYPLRLFLGHRVK